MHRREPLRATGKIGLPFTSVESCSFAKPAAKLLAHQHSDHDRTNAKLIKIGGEYLRNRENDRAAAENDLEIQLRECNRSRPWSTVG